MQAIRVHEFGSPEVMKLENIDIALPGPGQVLLKVMAIGVNPIDVYIQSGAYARNLTLPYTPGSDAAGIVEAVGENVLTCKAGDRVYTSGSLSGTYAQKALCAERQCHLLPANISFEQGAALGVPYGTAYRALFQRAKIQTGETVLIHGATGGVGIAAVQLAGAGVFNIIATGGSDNGLTILKSLGVNHILNHASNGYLDAIKSIAPNGVDVVLEMLANINLSHDLKILALSGRIVVIGNRGTIEIDPRDLMARDAAILGMTMYNAQESEVKLIHAALQTGLANGALNPIIGHEFSLDNAAEAHHKIMESGAVGKIVLVPLHISKKHF